MVNTVKEYKDPLSELLKMGDPENLLKIIEDKIKNAKPIVPGIILQGTVNVLAAKTGTGNTLLTIHMMLDSIRSGRIEPENLTYYHTSDTPYGYEYQAELASKYGFTLVNPYLKSSKSVQETLNDLKRLVDNSLVNGQVFVFDRAKFYTNIWHRSQRRKFLNLMGNIADSGGTVILLVHPNKHPDSSGNLILPDRLEHDINVDTVYTLYRSEEKKPLYEVELRNIKRCFDLDEKVLFTYQELPSYHQILNSVKRIKPGR